MSNARASDTAGVAAIAIVLMTMIAMPVLRSPSTRVFGAEIVGRHHDPFTTMAEFSRPFDIGSYAQPMTDVIGAAFARVFGPVAAYNYLVLLSFPLSTAAAFLLGRYLALSRASAAFAAMAYAFAPFHLAHAAYHPHIAAAAWLPLYLLALWRAIDAPTPLAIAGLAASVAAVVFSSYYGGFIAAVITPAAVAAYACAAGRTAAYPWRRLGITCASLVVIGGAVALSTRHLAQSIVGYPADFSASRDDLFVYSAKWWSYLVPPVEHPWLGAAARRIWRDAGVGDGLLEQQVYLGWSLIALSGVAIVSWLMPRRSIEPPASSALRRAVPVLTCIALVALVCSLSPERTIGGVTVVRPSALLYDIAPMFRAYARFGAVVQLMTVLLAGVGVDVLRRRRTVPSVVVCVVLVCGAIGEYAVSPSAMSRDVLPTAAHRWVSELSAGASARDCAQLTEETASIQWLTRGRITLSSSPLDCLEPHLAESLAETGATHLIVRRRGDIGDWFAARAAPSGLREAARFADARVFAVTAERPPLSIAVWHGFSQREWNPDWSWRWMDTDASWTIANNTAQSALASVEVELRAFEHSQRVAVQFDASAVQILEIDVQRRVYHYGPIIVSPGQHQLHFHAVETPAVPSMGAGDRRRLSFAFGDWSWTLLGRQP